MGDEGGMSDVSGRHGADSVGRVRSYYEKNTRLFLALGVGRKTLTMHRAVWAEGASSLSEAVDHVNGLIASQTLRMARKLGSGKLRVLDIGCGVGGSLLYLAAAMGARVEGAGITLSALQAGIAAAHARRRYFSTRCTFLTGDFTDLVPQRPFHLAFGIEAFVHFRNPEGFFDAAARSLDPGGLLIVVDDFLASEDPSPRDREMVRTFQAGWILPALCSVNRALHAATDGGFRLVEHRDLSAHLARPPIHPVLGRLLVRLMQALPVPWSYWQSTMGSLALSICQREGSIGYHFLVFEKSKV
jgi:cyclopropane fatty-acyl-phospholipid synthase-like methyltransferase